MTITKKDIQTLTPEHRVVWKEPSAPREVELGLWVDSYGNLRTDPGHEVRWDNGTVPESALARVIRIIEPVFTPRRGLVIGHPKHRSRRLDCHGDDLWLGRAPEISGEAYWFNNSDAHALIENHGWQIVDDLTKENDGPRRTPASVAPHGSETSR